MQTRKGALWLSPTAETPPLLCEGGPLSGSNDPRQRAAAPEGQKNGLGGAGANHLLSVVAPGP